MNENQKKFLGILDKHCVENKCSFTSNEFHTIWDAMTEYHGLTQDVCKVGLLARLTKRQTNRHYFSDLPVGTMFIVKEEIDLPGYDLLGYFIGCEPQDLGDNFLHHTGYVERGSWEIVGPIGSETVDLLKDNSASLKPLNDF